MILQEAISTYLFFKGGECSAETLKTDTVLLTQFTDWAGEHLCDPVSVDSITSADVLHYLDHHRGRGLSPYTVKRHHALLSAFWSWLTCDEVDLCAVHILKAVPAPRLPRHVVEVLTRDDLEAILAATRRGNDPRRDRALVLFLLDSCARASEVAGVQLPDLDMTRGRVLVTGKGDKQRYVYLGRRCLQAVWLYTKQERPEPMQCDSEHLFLTREGYPLNRDSLRKAVNRAGNRAGRHANPHLFRHTGATERLRRGMDLMSLKHLMGHERLSTTERYLTALQDEDTEAGARRTSPGDDWRL